MGCPISLPKENIDNPKNGDEALQPQDQETSTIYNPVMENTDIDFKIYLNQEINNNKECSPDKCKSVERLLIGLIYYQVLTNTKKANIDGNHIFNQFLEETYKCYLNDINHVVIMHDKDLEEVNELLSSKSHGITCSVDNCLLSDRNCQINDSKNGNININKTETDALSQFHQQTFDNVHFYLTHLFDLGLRQRQKELEEEKKGDDDIDEWGCVDKIFKQQRLMVESKRKKFPRFSGRFKPVSNKFVIQTLEQTDTNTNSNVEGTFMDKLYANISKAGKVSKEQLEAISEYFNDEEFDTDGITGDIQDVSFNEKHKLNILKTIEAESLRKSIFDFVQQHTFKRSAFSTGFCFFYWKHFGAKYEPRRVQDPQNRNDYGGFSQFDLFIEKWKYLNLKEEILSNNDNEVGINEYNENMVKVGQYIATDALKAMKSDYSIHDDTQHFELGRGNPISRQHIGSLLFYTDFSRLSTSFSRTFRRIEAGESLDGVKQRNMCYWWMSKFLIEAVNCFGNDGYTDYGGESGPFFCGLGIVMNVGSFRIRLTGPTSTSKTMQVATNFAKDRGMILQLNNQADEWTKWLKMFNVSFMSRYKEENERLFIHGQWTIEISSIRLTSTWQNFGTFFSALAKFDAALSGGNWEAVKGFTVKDARKIRLLLEEHEKMPPYVAQTWKMFLHHKKTLNVNLESVIEYYPSHLQDLILETTFGGSEDEDNLKYSDFEDNRNLLKFQLLNLFPNLNHILIECSGYTSYQFSFGGLSDILNVKSKTNKIKCSLYGVWKDRREGSGDSRSWLYYLYSSISSSLTAKYKNIKISMDKIIIEGGIRKDLLVFESI